ncbi:MAG TPA: aminoglycoside phosphotransferase family protein [Micromonosporaceae bacterium]|jgi:aminoglycoside phosphotransferase (APT) family kinase protein
MGKMHAGEADIDERLVGDLLAAQFPHWADLAIEGIDSSGTDNAIYRLGTDLAIRLPRIEGATGQAEWESRWLPGIAPLLPLAIPTPMALGSPGQGYPWVWAIYRWIDGESVGIEGIREPDRAATDLAAFLAALQGLDRAGGPAPATSGRGGPLTPRDPDVREALAELDDMIDVGAAGAAWDAAVRAPGWQSRSTWIHGDLHAGNLLANDGRLTAVIDFAGLKIGDPAVDLMVAWTFLDADSRATFRTAMSADDASWLRGSGWALSLGLIALPYYHLTNPFFADVARHAIAEVLADHATGRMPA